jgi:DNA repair exonuclease SbcCD ATPase subunit
MGFFDFFKKEKEKEKLAPVKTLNLTETGQLLDQKKEEINNKLKNSAEQTKKEINEEITTLKNNLNLLERAEIKNDNVPERAKQIMQGNRQIYIQKTSSLIGKITFPESPKETLEFIKTFDKQLDTFDKGIAKSHQILEEFFVEKASIIANNIKNIDRLLKELKKSLENSDLSKIEELKKKYSFLIEQLKKIEESRIKLNKLAKEINELDEQIKQKENKISELKQDESYKKVLSSIESKMTLETEISRLNSRAGHSFSEIEAALKKYENLSQSKLVKKYLENPISTVLEDNDLEILKILDATQKAIIKHEITLKDAKKDKIMNELFILNEDFFKDFKNKRQELDKNLLDKTKEIENSQILKDLAELEKSLNQDRSSVQEKTSVFEKMKKDMKVDNIVDLTKSLENSLKEKLNLDVKIV